MGLLLCIRRITYTFVHGTKPIAGEIKFPTCLDKKLQLCSAIARFLLGFVFFSFFFFLKSLVKSNIGAAR